VNPKIQSTGYEYEVSLAAGQFAVALLIAVVNWILIFAVLRITRVQDRSR
jgi:hypothetical protein